MGARERASVVLMRGHGEERIRNAMMQGLIRDELQKDVDEVLQQIDSIRGEYDLLYKNHQQLTRNHQQASQELEDMRRIYYDAVKSYQRETERKAKNDAFKQKLAHVAVIFLIVLVSTIISRAIFG